MLGPQRMVPREDENTRPGGCSPFPGFKERVPGVSVGAERVHSLIFFLSRMEEISFGFHFTG